MFSPLVIMMMLTIVMMMMVRIIVIISEYRWITPAAACNRPLPFLLVMSSFQSSTYNNLFSHFSNILALNKCDGLLSIEISFNVLNSLLIICTVNVKNT